MKTLVRSCLLLMMICCGSSSAWARVRLQNICTVQGLQEVRLQGLGIVIGLPGTGDGSKNEDTVRALKAVLAKLNQPPADGKLNSADNVALVLVEASIPKSGVKRGQKIDGYVSSPFGAKSLRGGRLLTTPLAVLGGKQKTAVALASGAVTIEDVKLATSGRLSLGVDFVTDVKAQFVNKEQDQAHTVTLLIDPAKASFWTSSQIATAISYEFRFEANDKNIARADGPGSVVVAIPETYQEQPEEFIAQVLEVGVDSPHTQARVILNSTSGMVFVTGEVEISPVIITHKNFNIEVGGDAEETPNRFLAIGEGQNRQTPVQLKQLQDALNKLRVPPADIIGIIRELHATGKLHAELIDK